MKMIFRTQYMPAYGIFRTVGSRSHLGHQNVSIWIRNTVSGAAHTHGWSSNTMPGVAHSGSWTTRWPISRHR